MLELKNTKISVQQRKNKKWVTIIIEMKDMPENLRKLKNVFSTGGTIKKGRIELQGNHQRRLERMRDGICQK